MLSATTENEPSTPKLLGKGAFGIVYEGKWNGVKVAIKRIDKTEFLASDGSITNATTAGQRSEEEVMKKLDHPNVLKLLHVEIDKNFKYFYLELCLATIGDYCKGKYAGPMPPEANSLHQMASGLAYIHSIGLVHRDIKEDNVLIYKSAEDCIWLKISDFGLCKLTSASGSYSMRSGVKGNQKFFSPELLQLADQQARSFDSVVHQRSNVSSDVFALGCLFHSYLTKGKHPFSDSRGSFFIPINILEGKFHLDDQINTTFRLVITGMIILNPETRWSLDAVEVQLKPHLTTN
ncbi:serine/threonine-protein kinase/endoribonuclease IRE1-like [Daphnia pulicaria]|uniref:serine/threonine-protein kinase/endoribonuclease IRE1-like n=1 Tax=Daphnia pulicaria TaxID=35523 RepID=UPI001EE9FA9E|nr:serine/threonine-protein kinase/endoribonuclease IRE1-like [Daphnia pulicaria]XP_046653164.1 serine/threonine-protein kinase/endoribonuclease IRE1-like [Daphnia pulicaria]